MTDAAMGQPMTGCAPPRPTEPPSLFAHEVMMMLVIALVALVFIRWVNRAGRAFGIADTLPCRPSLWQGTSRPSNRR